MVNDNSNGLSSMMKAPGMTNPGIKPQDYQPTGFAPAPQLSTMQIIGKGIAAAANYIPVVGPFISSLVGGAIDNAAAKKSQKQAEQRANAEYDRRLADERAYNSPSAIAARLRSAGINPMAAYSQIAGATGGNNMSAPSLSSMTGAPSIMSGFANSLSSMVNLGKMMPEIGKTRADTDKLLSDIKLISANTEFISQQTLTEQQETKLKKLNVELQEATQGTQISTYIETLAKLRAEVKEIDANSAYYKELTRYQGLAYLVEQFNLDKVLPAQVELMAEQAFNQNAQGRFTISQDFELTNFDLPAKKLYGTPIQHDFEKIIQEWYNLGLVDEANQLKDVANDIQRGNLNANWVRSLSGTAAVVVGAILVATGYSAPLGYALMGIGGVQGATAPSSSSSPSSQK